MLDIVQLQRKLQEARNEGEGEIPFSTIRMRTAKREDANKWLRSGYSPEDVTLFTGISRSEVDSELVRIQDYNRSKQKYLATGYPGPGHSDGGYLAIIN